MWTVEPLLLGTIDVPEHTVVRGAGDRPHTVPVLSFLVTNGDTAVLVDSGFDEHYMDQIWVPHTLEPGRLKRSLADRDLETGDVALAINTHLHSDHAGMNRALERATVVVQASELGFAQSPPDEQQTAYRPRSSFTKVPQERFRLVEGDVELHDGLRLLHTPGHTPGSQAVAVHTARGWVVITGDACDDQRQWDGETLPGIADDLDQFTTSLDRLREVADVPIFGHDLQQVEYQLRDRY